MVHTVNFEPLIQLLDDLLAQYEKVYELAEMKKESMISCDVDSLEKNVREETSALLKAGAMEKKRAALAGKIASELFLDPNSASLSDLIKCAGEPQKSRLSALWSSFDGLVKRLTAINDLNRRLLETNIAYTQMMLNVYVGASDPLNNLYGEDGNTGGDMIANPGLFDQQV